MGCCTSQPVGDNGFKPSSFALSVACPQRTAYSPGYQGRRGGGADQPGGEKEKEEAKRGLVYTGTKKILVIGNEERFLEMENGKRFDTGNHPVETLVPLLYLRDAGFSFDFATPTGKPVHLEMWAFPSKDTHVKELYDALKPRLDAPLKLHEVDASLDDYAAIFIPGGHGAMHLVGNADLGVLLRSAHAQQLTTISICHGPAGLLAASVGSDPTSEFIYKDYKLNVFPDSVDEFSPKIGYMPGRMKLPLCRALLDRGVQIMNTKDDDSTYVHKELITGASPKASVQLGKLAADELVKKLCAQ